VEISMFTAGLINTAPFLIVWITAIVIAAVLLRRRRGRAEKFLLIGAGVMLLSSLLIIPGVIVVPYLVERGATLTDASFAARSLNLLRGIISMAGIVCLSYAFWVKFKIDTASRPNH
jgi:cytochrome bd-type quinol oxidase subunit 2